MQRIAVISDIHGNLPALRAVLDDIGRRSVDAVYCLGDLVDFAPWPNEVIDLIKKEGIPCLLGNHDEGATFNLPILPMAKHGEQEKAARNAALLNTQQILTDESREYLASLPNMFLAELTTTGQEYKVSMVHASIDSNNEYIYENHAEAELNEMLAQQNVDALIMGHTHLPYIRRLKDGKLAINCGSVGRSREEIPYATYLILAISNEELNPEIIRIPFEVNETISAIEKSDIPNFYADFFRNKMP